MPCLITGGIAKDCDYLIGGLKAIYLANIEDVDSYTDTAPGDGIINAIVMVATKTFFTYEFNDNTGAFTQELAVNAGQKYVTQGVSFAVATKDAAVIADLKNLTLAKLVAIAEDRNGNRCILGRLNGIEATATTLSSGAAEGDAAGLNVTLSGAEIEWAPVLDPAFDINTIL